MADAILMSGGVGGVASDDVTARREHVLQGYTALTSDSDDEPVQGTIPNRGHRGANTDNFSEVSSFGGYVVGFAEGYYKNEDGRQPYVVVPTSTVKQAVNYHPEKTLNDTVTCGERGTIPNRGTWNTASEVVNAPWESTVHTRIEEGYYPKEGQYKPTAKIPYATLANVLVIDTSKMLDSYSVLGKRGTISRWVCTTGDIITALGGEGFAYDDNYANRGRGIVVKIPNGYYIQGASWVFLPSPNLSPQNVRAGVNINGVVGTMPDYSTGRTVFNGATFDGLLASGVATKGFYANGTYYAYNIQSGYAYGGIYGGGMNLQLNTTYTALRSRRIGCVLSQSINVTPFRQIVVYYRSVANIQGNPYVSLEVHVSRASVRGQANVSGAIVDTIDIVRQGTASPAINREGQIVLDVSAINEHIFLSFGAFCNQDRASDIFAGAVQITRVDFLN